MRSRAFNRKYAVACRITEKPKPEHLFAISMFIFMPTRTTIEVGAFSVRERNSFTLPNPDIPKAAILDT
jgi:hypothetical protein